MTKKFDFTENYEKLKKITEAFESGKFSLEDGLEKFEEGLKIAEDLKKYLKSAENRVKEIKSIFSDEK